VGTEKRERQKANRAARRERDLASQRAADRRSRITLFAIIGVFVFAALLLFRYFGSDDAEDVISGSSTTTTTATTTTIDPSAPTLIAVTVPAAGGSITGDTPCPAEDGSAERITSFESAPPMCIDPAAVYLADIETTEGKFTVELDATSAPTTVNNFVVLARYHYYDDVAFHRIIPGFVVHGGDAVGPTPGSGGPGYRFDDELPEIDETTGLAYAQGDVAMANSGENTNGAQFFVVTGAQGEALPPNYSKFGRVIAGMDVVAAIEAAGSPGAGTPTEEIRIDSITISER
jgi:cyclophilin family peptidyl-prolyl cis-trans isomerase